MTLIIQRKSIQLKQFNSFFDLKLDAYIDLIESLYTLYGRLYSIFKNLNAVHEIMASSFHIKAILKRLKANSLLHVKLT